MNRSLVWCLINFAKKLDFVIKQKKRKKWSKYKRGELVAITGSVNISNQNKFLKGDDMKRFVFLFMFIMLSSLAFADGFKTEQDCRLFSDKLMDHFINTNFQEGLNSTKPYWPIPEIEIDGLTNQIKQQWPIVDRRFGKAIAKEFVGEKRIGKSFLRYYYLHKFENHSIYWRIDFYKPHEKWIINSIIFLDKLDPLFE